jgi:hypothetical protein
VLVDEISRANPQMQSKWLEVIRERRIMGQPLPDLQQVLAAMNPPSYLGAFPLDEALAGRFTVVATVPEVGGMSAEDRRSVVLNRTEQDAPGLTRDFGSAPPASGRSRGGEPGWDLRAELVHTRARMRVLQDNVRERIATYVLAFASVLEREALPLDGRRLGMLHRLLCAAVCLEVDDLDEPDDEVLEPVLRRVVPFGLPFVAVGREFSPTLFRSAHCQGIAAAAGAGVTGLLRLPADPVEAVAVLAAELPDADSEVKAAAITSFLERVADEDLEQKDRARAFYATTCLAGDVVADHDSVSPDDMFRVLEWFRRATEIRYDSEFGFIQGVQAYLGAPRHAAAFAPHKALALRVSVNTLEQDHEHCDAEAIAELAEVVGRIAVDRRRA